MNNTITEVSLNVAAADFGKYIKNLPEFKTFEEAQATFNNDSEAQLLMENYNNKVQSLQLMQQMGQPQEKLQQEFEAMNNELEKNAVLTNLLESRDILIEKLQTINADLSDLLGFDFASLAKPPSSCCS